MKKYSNTQFIYFEVALPLPFYQTFTYKLSLEKYNKLKNKELIGRRVLVPFRKSGYTGIITEIHKESFSEIEDYEIKEIEELPDDKPLFTEKELNIAYNLSQYYIAPFGLTLYYFIPEGLRWKKKEGKWIKTFPESYIYTLGEIRKYENLSERQKELVELVSSLGEITELELIEQGFNKTTINSLVKKGILKKESFILKKEGKIQLKQQTVEKSIKVNKGLFYYGSDTAEKRLKTYINIINKLQQEGKSSLLIFPSIAHIKKAYEILSKEINNLYVYHDGINARENVRTWFELQEKEGSVLLTSYARILIPIKNLSFIVVEEEAADSYKTLRTPKFDVRRAVFEIYKEKN
ncbi:hypothetical protein [Hydrogenivirga sp. 128-5-R1-1]|uniref:primosomal protein N' family DNA-binding protein n=1 Tax=Hydrogenivirga sp. 128-5-R1-1 TaxID=392423 RepID=UPI00015F04B6|nr:hypothetical protein [Hydrogenivirga sp. 128-5-R1-1]EDP74072.1 primosome assembly protein PriA [Hydrogenivirga sp. 128-5-R1-1]